MQKVFLQRLSFLDAEAIDHIQGLPKRFVHLGDESLVVIFGGHVKNARHSEQDIGQVGRRRDARLVRNRLNLLLVGFHNVGVDAVGLRQIGVGNRNQHIDFATLQFGGNAVADVQFGKAKLVGYLYDKIQLLAVQRLDFDGDFLGVISLLGNAVASH